ncbi:hypothetical protein ACEWY4_009161 [Coilia grayii]|uniref:Uncharacterized protein n=1 Tax=Coilia grayii TaxID=363190 RepID=A0ABD1K5P4_9TELE
MPHWLYTGKTIWTDREFTVPVRRNNEITVCWTIALNYSGEHQGTESCLTPVVLRQLNPQEAQLLTDPSRQCKVRFSMPQATPQACRIMGKRKFLAQLVMDEQQRRGQSVADASDVVCMRDFMQYSSHLDELPAHLGGRSNSWRTLSLRPPPAHGMMYTHLESSLTGRVGVTHGRDLLLGTPPTLVACGEARLSRRRVGTLRSPAAPPSSVQMSRSSSRSSPAASSSKRSRRFHRAISMKMRQLYITGHQNETLGKSPDSAMKVRPADIVLPSASLMVEEQEEGFTTSPSSLSDDSDWEENKEEVERLCDWSKHLGEEYEDDIDPVN